MMAARVALALIASVRALTCPEEHCDADVALVHGPFPSCGVAAERTQLDALVSPEGDTLVELLGPADPERAAAVVITAPHGGSLRPEYVRTRTADHEWCPASGCKLVKDAWTLELAERVADGFAAEYCRVPYLVVNHLHREKLDANREIREAAQNDTRAEGAWWAFHDFASAAQALVEARHGTLTGTTGLAGVPGLLFDIHGYSGYDWDAEDGSPLVHWGYRLSTTSLDPELYCPLDTRSYGTIGTYSHARFLEGESLECLVRGPRSLGSRLAGLLPLDGGADCGKGLPSLEFPSPKALAANETWCEDLLADPADTCHYFSGGYDVEVHEHLEWETKTGPLMAAVQAELPRCLRWATPGTRGAVHAATGRALAIAICSFVQDVFGTGCEGPPDTAGPTAAPSAGTTTTEPTADLTTAGPTAGPSPGPTTAAPTRGPTAAPTAPCLDDGSWHRRGRPAKDCAWVALNPTTNRCKRRGEDSRRAKHACRASCGTCL
mmetsp:Transcript_7527/g.22302  ORF Transcript_7527/g.22302 Transcript_7527/m.22302 type:complete len:494 (+) Transcript_7527:157-1638(+)